MSKNVRCKNCGKTGLDWMKYDGQHRLFEGDKLHQCSVKRLYKPELDNPTEREIKLLVLLINSYMTLEEYDASMCEDRFSKRIFACIDKLPFYLNFETRKLIKNRYFEEYAR